MRYKIPQTFLLAALLLLISCDTALQEQDMSKGKTKA